MITAALPYILVFVVTGVLGFAVNSVLHRINRVEVKTDLSITENSVRQILSDKLEPIQDDISIIKSDIKQLIETKAIVDILQKIKFHNDRE